MLGTVIGGVGCSYPGHALAEISEDCHTQPQPSPGTKQMRSNSEGHVCLSWTQQLWFSSDTQALQFFV